MIKLISVDLDGTLFNEEKKTGPDFDKALSLMEKNNVLFVISSGRNYLSIMRALPEIKDKAVYIASNGAHIVYRGTTIFVKHLTKDDTYKAICAAEGIKNISFAYETASMVFIKNCRKDLYDGLVPYNPVHKVVGNFYGIEEPAIELTIYDADGHMNNSHKPLRDAKLSSARVVSSGYNWIDILDKTTSKGSAIEFLQKKFGISKDESAAFGDNYNDVELLDAVTHSYAMKNAVDELKQRAKYITEKDNESFGAVDEIMKLLS